MNNTGKGVYDPGACHDGWQEHKYVEKFVDDLAASIEALGGQVTMTEDIPLGARIAKVGADATSFHFNAGGGTGTEVWVPLLCSPASWKKSDRIGRAVAAALGLPYRGTKRSNRLSITNHGFERLIEVIFIDTDKDRAAFASRRRSAINAFIGAV
jgi:N-acetylmuramoyl-L-alanine amidase